MKEEPNKIIKFAFKGNCIAMGKELNRIKVVLVECKRTNKWLAEQLGVNPTTISKWCTNTTQPDLYTLNKVADLLGVDVTQLLLSNRVESHQKVHSYE